MANPNEERNDRFDPNGAELPPEQGFNTIRNSAIEIREKKATRRTYTFLGIIGLTVLLVVVLLVTAIGGIIANVANSKDPSVDPSGTPLDKNVVWTEITVGDADTKTGALVLVNATHEYTFPADESHLELIYAAWAQHSPAVYKLGLSSHMEKTALAAMDQMLADFSTATGKTNVLVRYAYRTAEEQTELGSSILAGYSDHHTGFGCDLKYLSDGKQYEFSADPTYDWIKTNMTKYGFVTRYPEAKAEITGVSDYESYFRYVGVAHATYMSAQGLCMEEYIEAVKSYTQKDPLKITGADGKSYEVYYVAVKGNTTVKVPKNFVYTVSGTNDGGVIVTINRSEAPAPAESETVSSSETAAGTTATTPAA